VTLFVAVALVVMNLATFAMFGSDKAAAVGKRSRVPERTLLTLAALGGSPGALLARPVFRHKTRKQPFGAWLMLIVFLQASALVAGAALGWRGPQEPHLDQSAEHDRQGVAPI
jgi:uncharacterized membrane protein YsdA (DUF1294 family)